MKDKIKCLKETLNYISQNTGYDKYATFYNVIQNSDFSKDMVLNTIYECENEGLFSEVEHMEGAPDTGRIYSLSPEGRKFLENLNTTPIEKIIQMIPTVNNFFSLIGTIKSILFP